MSYNVAIVGATGAVGEKFIEILEERKFPISDILLLASKKSAGTKITFRDEKYKVDELHKNSFNGIDIAFFSAGSKISNQYAPFAVEAGAVVIDNSSAFRMKEEVPLVVPEVNPQSITNHKGIIANPNCSTIQLVVALKPIYDRCKINKIVVSTYQSVSGGGKDCVTELTEQSQSILEGKPAKSNVFPHQIAFNAIPQIPQTDAFLSNGYTTEEMKLVNETRKIFNDYSIDITPTCVRIPVFTGHSESVEITCDKKINITEIKQILIDSPGVTVLDDPGKEIYPLATHCDGKDEVFVGRIRESLFDDHSLNLWIVSDNLRKGAALNAIQIAEILMNKSDT